MKIKNMLLCVLSCTSTQYPFDQSVWLEIKPSYFFFASEPMNKIYHRGGFQVQGSVSVPVYKHLDLYGSVGYQQASGHALNSCQTTTIKIVPIDIGVKPVFNFCETYDYFFVAGPRFFYFQQDNQSAYVDPCITGGNVGFFVNTGAHKNFSNNLLVGIFGEYWYGKKQICPTLPYVYSDGPAQIGGFAFGATLGYQF